MRIVLLGYMASGKSAIGKALAKKKDLKIIDLDSYIEEREQMSISNIFSDKGEIYFRKKEGEYLNELFDLYDNCIISVGGGTPCYGNNMDSISKNSTAIYLKASIDTIFNRLLRGAAKRPLVATIGTDNLKEYIAKHLFERSPYYERAHKTIKVDDKSIDENVNAILQLL
ncbi:shikimate kinase [Lutibacter sp. B1]|uniref:shikimate kinase n=1 Tax=Lutibacter sp. B1 TaxID=2725996 RepID=UPI0014565206|nr:shikimate kinase [Lutibacter sp. B1]NLP58291.1 shikimate kinase [Lutibacter sp. B1]